MGDLGPVPASVIAMNLEDQPQPHTIGGSLLCLFQSKKLCDVVFTFPDLRDKIEAHELCLRARSPVFDQIFQMRKSGNVQGSEIQISESTPEIFQHFLEFIYVDKFDVNIAGALELMQLSHKYKVYPLTRKCEELLKTEIPTVDSVKVFETARRYGHRELMDRAGPIMAKSFLKLARADSLANAEEETLVYLLECDHLDVKEVGLFQFILDWGKKQAGASADDGLLKNKLKNLISKIRYTNMAPDEFTKVVVPTGLLSAEETVTVYSYFCGDEVTRRDLKTKFDTTRRKVEDINTVAELVNFYKDGKRGLNWFPAFSKHSISFNADRTQVDGKVQPDYFLRRTAITAIQFYWPLVNSKYREHHVINFAVSVVEYSGPAKEGNFTVRLEKKLLNCKKPGWDMISLEPPVQLVSGRTYSVIVEDHSTSGSIDSFRKDLKAHEAFRFTKIHREANADFEDVRLILRDIHRKTDFYAQNLPEYSGKFAPITGIQVKLM